MTYRQFWSVALLVAIVTVGRHVVGNGAVAAYFIVVGVVGVVATVIFHRHRGRVTRHLAEMSEEDRTQTLVLLENNPLRAGLVAEIDVEAPRVPLRGSVEVFRYPAEAARTGTWTMYGCAWLAGFAGVGSLSDLVLGTHRFVGPETAWWEVPALTIGFGVAAAFMWWSVQESRGVLEITDDAITWRVPGRTSRRIAWDDVTSATLGDPPQSIRIQSRTVRIGLSSTLVDFGRALNLIATRLPRNGS
jgi:hypothetical protein